MHSVVCDMCYLQIIANSITFFCTLLVPEVTVLISRSLFPIHPLAAAIQSIGVCRREVENDKRCKLGRGIIFPSVVLHGTFDFLLLVIPFLFSLGKNDRSESTECKAVLYVCSGLVMVCGIAYYVNQAAHQRRRIGTLDEAKALVVR